MKAENDELPRFVLARNAWRLNHKLLDIEADAASFQNLVHKKRLRFGHGDQQFDSAWGWENQTHQRIAHQGTSEPIAVFQDRSVGARGDVTRVTGGISSVNSGL
jgi:hypothetical protein